METKNALRFVSTQQDAAHAGKEAALRKKKQAAYLNGLRKVGHDHLILTNKPSFTEEKRCPHCGQRTKKEQVRITKGWKVLTATVRHCEPCGADYITPAQFNALNRKMQKRAREQAGYSFIRPKNVACEFEEGKYLFIPRWMMDPQRFSHRALPARNDAYYDMTDEEYLWVKALYEPEDISVKLRPQSFLGAEGYSTAVPEAQRHRILARCAEKYGKNKVINQLRCSIRLRIRQKDGASRYEYALNTWRGDIWYVENKL